MRPQTQTRLVTGMPLQLLLSVHFSVSTSLLLLLLSILSFPGHTQLPRRLEALSPNSIFQGRNQTDPAWLGGPVLWPVGPTDIIEDGCGGSHHSGETVS